MTRARRAFPAVVLALLTACQGVLFTAPPGSEIVSLVPNPGFIPSHGGVSVISALVIEEAGTLVPDGTVVQFVTTLGRIDREGKTRNGVARVNLVSDSRSGEADILAFSGEAQREAQVLIGNRNVARIRLRAEPPRITDSTSTHVIATVFDDFGNPVGNVPVFFRVRVNVATEFFDQQGPVFTNTNGEAENVLRTRRSDASRAVPPIQVDAQVPGPNGLITSDVLIISII